MHSGWTSAGRSASPTSLLVPRQRIITTITPKLLPSAYGAIGCPVEHVELLAGPRKAIHLPLATTDHSYRPKIQGMKVGAGRPIGDLTCPPMLQSYPTSSVPPTPLHNHAHGYSLTVFTCVSSSTLAISIRIRRPGTPAVSTYVVPQPVHFTLSGSRISSHFAVRHYVCHLVTQYPTANFRGHRVGHCRGAMVSIPGGQANRCHCVQIFASITRFDCEHHFC